MTTVIRLKSLWLTSSLLLLSVCAQAAPPAGAASEFDAAAKTVYVNTAAEPPEEFQEKELTDANYAKWRDHVLPKNWELSYRKIPWKTSFWDAVIEAQAKDKPILLWSMNGHPLCNT